MAELLGKKRLNLYPLKPSSNDSNIKNKKEINQKNILTFSPNLESSKNTLTPPYTLDKEIINLSDTEDNYETDPSSNHMTNNLNDGNNKNEHNEILIEDYKSPIFCNAFWIIIQNINNLHCIENKIIEPRTQIIFKIKYLFSSNYLNNNLKSSLHLDVDYRNVNDKNILNKKNELFKIKIKITDNFNNILKTKTLRLQNNIKNTLADIFYPKNIINILTTINKKSQFLKINIQLIIDILKEKKMLLYKGIENEGSTCYLNSLVQLLYRLPLFSHFIKYFTISNPNNIIYIDLSENESICIDSESDNDNLENNFDINKCIDKFKSFQDLFLNLEDAETNFTKNKKRYISALKFVQSFGLSSNEINNQNDIHEFLLNLSNIIHSVISHKRKNDIKYKKIKNIFKYLFSGKIENKIKCLNVNYESSNKESFTNIQLAVKNCRTIYQSLDNFTQDELLVGDNKYLTEKFGLQDAKKSSKFFILPKILLIQLKRFEYNSENKKMEKINDEFQFYEKLDLSKYSIDKNVNNEYYCKGVIVHFGSINSGHYYVYFKTNNKDWILFNDKITKFCYDYEVFNNNYGGKNCTYSYNCKSQQFLNKCEYTNWSAYMLLYVRKDSIDEVFNKESYLQLF